MFPILYNTNNVLLCEQVINYDDYYYDDDDEVGIKGDEDSLRGSRHILCILSLFTLLGAVNFERRKICAKLTKKMKKLFMR